MIEFLANGANATSDSVSIPITNLSSAYTYSTHFQTAADKLRYARLINAFFEKAYAYFTLNTTDHLGITLTKDIDDLAASTPVLFYDVWTLVQQRYIEYASQPEPLPLPPSGAGDFDLLDIFPNASKVDSGDAVTADSVLFPVEDLEVYGSPAYASLTLTAGQDNRNVWMSMASYLINNATIRATGVSAVTSAVISKTVNIPTNITVPDSFTNATNPLTGISAADLYGKAFVSSQTMILTLEQKRDPVTRLYDVNYV